MWHPVLAVATKAVELLRVASQRGGLATPVEGGVPPARKTVRNAFKSKTFPNIKQSYRHTIPGRRGGKMVNLGLIS